MFEPSPPPPPPFALGLVKTQSNSLPFVHCFVYPSLKMDRLLLYIIIQVALIKLVRQGALFTDSENEIYNAVRQ